RRSPSAARSMPPRHSAPQSRNGSRAAPKSQLIEISSWRRWATYYRTVVTGQIARQALRVRRTRRVITHAMTDQRATQQSIPSTFVAVPLEVEPLDIEKSVQGSPSVTNENVRAVPRRPSATTLATKAGREVRWRAGSRPG